MLQELPTYLKLPAHELSNPVSFFPLYKWELNFFNWLLGYLRFSLLPLIALPNCALFAVDQGCLRIMPLQGLTASGRIWSS